MAELVVTIFLILTTQRLHQIPIKRWNFDDHDVNKTSFGTMDYIRTATSRQRLQLQDDCHCCDYILISTILDCIFLQSGGKNLQLARLPLHRRKLFSIQGMIYEFPRAIRFYVDDTHELSRYPVGVDQFFYLQQVISLGTFRGVDIIRYV